MSAKYLPGGDFAVYEKRYTEEYEGRVFLALL